MAYESGIPWQQQYGSNSAQSGDIDDWAELTAETPVALVSVKAIVARGFIYLIGSPFYLSTYYRAPVNTDGTIGSWSSYSLGTTLNNTAECLIAGSKIYIVGDGTTTVRYATLATDGSIGSWTSANSLPAARVRGRAMIIGRRMYYIGGHNSTAQSSVYYTDLDSNDVIGTWSTSGDSLPSGRCDFALVYAGDKIHVVSGITNPMSTYVTGGFTASVSSNVIGAWSASTYDLPVEIANAQVAVSTNTAYIIGGFSGSTTSVFTFYASIDGEGNLSSWSYGTELPYAASRSGGASAITSSKIYILGGWNDGGNQVKLVSASFAGGLNDYMGGTAQVVWLYTC